MKVILSHVSDEVSIMRVPDEGYSSHVSDEVSRVDEGYLMKVILSHVSDEVSIMRVPDEGYFMFPDEVYFEGT